MICWSAFDGVYVFNRIHWNHHSSIWNNSLGTQIITAHTAARKLYLLFCLPLSTLAASMATFVSQTSGAQNYERIIKGVRLSNICGIIYPIFLSILIYFTAENLVHLIWIQHACRTTKWRHVSCNQYSIFHSIEYTIEFKKCDSRLWI